MIGPPPVVVAEPVEVPVVGPPAPGTTGTGPPASSEQAAKDASTSDPRANHTFISFRFSRGAVDSPHVLGCTRHCPTIRMPNRNSVRKSDHVCPDWPRRYG